MIDQAKDKNKYLAKCFNKKTLIQKAIIAACALVIVLSFSLSFYFWLKDMTEGQEIGKNPFWYIHIIWNDGIGFSALSGNLTAIYSIQTIMFALMVVIFLFLSNDRTSASFVALAMFGGFFNLIQRAAETGAHVGCVLDYFMFGFMDFAIFNWPDTFVVIGIFGFVISFITITVIDSVKESRKERAEARRKAKK